MTVTVTTIGPLMAAAPVSVPKELQEAFSLSLLWSETIAAQTDADIRTQAYFNALTAELGRVAWMVTNASTDIWSSSGAQTDAAGAVKSIAGQYMPKGQISPLLAVLDRMTKMNDSDPFSNFLTTWWDSLDQRLSGQVFAASPVIQDANGLLTSIVTFMEFGSRQGSWQSFFLGQVSKSARITVHHAEIRLNAKLWTTLRDPIAQKLGDRARKEIQSIDI